MGFIESIQTALVSASPTDRPDDKSRGAYWCDDCDIRIRDVDLEGEPVCPECETEMRFERATGRNCAC